MAETKLSIFSSTFCRSPSGNLATACPRWFSNRAGTVPLAASRSLPGPVGHLPERLAEDDGVAHALESDDGAAPAVLGDRNYRTRRLAFFTTASMMPRARRKCSRVTRKSRLVGDRVQTTPFSSRAPFWWRAVATTKGVHARGVRQGRYRHGHMSPSTESPRCARGCQHATPRVTGKGGTRRWSGY
jgi:hypothetical protein